MPRPQNPPAWSDDAAPTAPIPRRMGFSGLPINVPWGLSIDGNDDVWFGNFYGRGVILMAGEDTKGHPAGTKTGDVDPPVPKLQHPDDHRGGG